MRAIPWDSPPQRAGGKFHKWKEGRNRVRFLSQPVEYEREFKGELRTEYLAAVLDLDDGEKEKFASLKPAMLTVLRDFFVENGIAPDAPEAPAFSVTRSGTGLQTRYTMLPGKPCPIGRSVDVAKAQAELFDLVKKQERKAATDGDKDADGRKEEPALEF